MARFLQDDTDLGFVVTIQQVDCVGLLLRIVSYRPITEAVKARRLSCSKSFFVVGMKSSSDSKKDKDSPFNTPLEQWKVDQVCKWFETQKLTTSTVSALRIAKVDGEKLLQLTRYPTLLLENFRELGVPDEELPAFELSVKNLKDMFAAQEKAAKKPMDSSSKKEERVQSPWADASVLSVSAKKNGGPSGSAPAAQDFVDSRGLRQKADTYGRSSRDALVNEVVDEELRSKTK